MKLLILLAIVSVVYASTDRAVYNEWKAHVAKYNRKYSSAEHAREGFQNFAREYERVLEHNKKFRAGHETFEAGLNQFSDMSDEEKEQLIGLKPPMSVPFESSKRSIDTRNLWKSANGYIYNQIVADANLPASVDYTKYAGTVRDQKTCGSCYSFTANKVLEMNLRKKFNQSYDLAPQQLVDCGFAVGDNGCNGGVPDVTFDYFMSNAGCFLKESEYPYKSAVQTKSVDQCVALCSTKSIKAKISGYVRAIQNDLNSVKTLLTQGPVFGALHVNTKGPFYSYKSGLLNDPSVGTPNHAITVIGYQKINGTDAFKILNSWSTSWGEGGFGYIRADQLNILSYAYYPNVTLSA